MSVNSTERSAHVADEGVANGDVANEDVAVTEHVAGEDEHTPSRDLAKRERRQFITHNAVAAAGTWGAGIAGLDRKSVV